MPAPATAIDRPLRPGEGRGGGLAARAGSSSSSHGLSEGGRLVGAKDQIAVLGCSKLCLLGLHNQSLTRRREESVRRPLHHGVRRDVVRRDAKCIEKSLDPLFASFFASSRLRVRRFSSERVGGWVFPHVSGFVGWFGLALRVRLRPRL